MREIEKVAGELAARATSPFDLVEVISVDGRYVLRVCLNDELEIRVRHRKARRRIGVVRLRPDAPLEFIHREVTACADAIVALPPYRMDAYAYIEDPDDPQSPWRVSVHVDHEEGAERVATILGLTREQAVAINDAFAVAANVLEAVQR